MADPHQVVINHTGQVVGRKSVTLQQDLLSADKWNNVLVTIAKEYSVYIHNIYIYKYEYMHT